MLCYGLIEKLAKGINMSNSNDIESLIGELTPEQIKALMTEIKKPKIRTIDTSYARRRMEITRLYFSAEPKPHMEDGTWQEYSAQREGVRQQVLSGVDL